MAQRKRALVTGGATGIGRAAVLHLARAGFDVVLNYRSSEARAREVAAEAERLGARALLLPGDVAPSRIIKGPQTRLTYPVGVFVDSKNKEVWVSNIGNSTATVYPLMANGDVPPLRMIRSAEENKESLRFGKTTALVYDSKREEILVPN